MGVLNKKSIFIAIGIIYVSLCFSQKANFSVSEIPFCTSINDEFAPMYYMNGLVFCSNALSNTTIQSDDGKLFNILYAQQRDSGNWKNPDLFSKELTTILNEGPASFKPDCKTVFYARNNLIEGKFKDINDPSNTMGIFSAELIEGIWGNIQAFAYNSAEYSLGTPALSTNGLRIYFASDMLGGYGGTDLYYSDFFSGTWQQPVNMGGTINTKGNESYPYINQAEQLFFSSDGLPGLGGKDIFFTTRKEGVWQPPIHLGRNINSTADDYGIITDVNFDQGYFSSNRKHSDDIYSFKSELPQFGYCDALSPKPQCFVFFDDRFTDSLHLQYEWNFGKGTIKKGYRVEHCFEDPGDYEVVLTIKHNLADSVFETKAIHRFTIENIQLVFILSESVSVKNNPIYFEGFLNGFKNFEIRDSFWDFGNGYLNDGATANNIYTKAGEYIVSYGLEGLKDNYGRIPRKCFTKQIAIVEDYQELADYYYKNKDSAEIQEILTGLSAGDINSKDVQESFRINFRVLSNQLPLLEIDKLERSFKKLRNQYIQLENGELNTTSVKLIEQIVEVLKEYPGERMIIAIHKGIKGSSKANQQMTELVAEKINKIIENKALVVNLVQSVGYGDNRPLVTNKEKHEPYINQRIEFIVLSNSEEK